uniref:Uncharacterized protein n=1 Tax=Oryza glaberrima TaxID=4538 RepID=I1P909_ORYGL
AISAHTLSFPSSLPSSLIFPLGIARCRRRSAPLYRPLDSRSSTSRRHSDANRGNSPAAPHSLDIYISSPAAPHTHNANENIQFRSISALSVMNSQKQNWHDQSRARSIMTCNTEWHGGSSTVIGDSFFKGFQSDKPGKLCFDDDRQSRWRRLANFGGFVDWAFAQRGDADIQSVIIFMSRLDSATPEQVNEWLRYAVRRVVKTFWFNACDSTPIGAWWAPPPRDHGHQLPTVELPSHGRTASINLNLSSYPFRLKLPASPAARYEALTDLSLSSAWFGEDEAVAGRRTLADFISSCCPRLRKQIIDPMRLPQLVLRAEALEELIVASTRDTQTMDVTAPNLRIFELHYFNSMTSVTSYGESIDLVVRITAPRLEEIAINNSTLEIEDNLDLRIHGLASVRRLKNLTLAMHGHNCCNTDYG